MAGRNELLCKILCHDLRVNIMAMYGLGLWHEAGKPETGSSDIMLPVSTAPDQLSDWTTEELLQFGLQLRIESAWIHRRLERVTERSIAAVQHVQRVHKRCAHLAQRVEWLNVSADALLNRNIAPKPFAVWVAEHLIVGMSIDEVREVLIGWADHPIRAVGTPQGAYFSLWDFIPPPGFNVRPIRLTFEDDRLLIWGEPANNR